MSISQSQWQEINQPDIGSVSIILADGNQLFTATNQAQVYTSIDQADSWEMLADWGPWQELPHQSSALISMVDNDSLIFTLLNGISISSDRGETWAEIPEHPITGYIRLNLATNDSFTNVVYNFRYRISLFTHGMDGLAIKKLVLDENGLLLHKDNV